MSDAEEILNESQYEKIVDALIADSKNKLNDQFLRLTAHYSRATNPIGPNDAKNIINSLITTIIGQRRLLSARIADSIGFGELFDKYFGQLSLINDLHAKRAIALKELQVAETKYMKKRNLLEKVERTAYMGEFAPDDSDIIREENYDE